MPPVPFSPKSLPDADWSFRKRAFRPAPAVRRGQAGTPLGEDLGRN
jgi:hypothetical protein